MRKASYCAVAVVFLLFSRINPALGQDGAGLYKLLCATCHDGGNERAPARETLRQMTPERVLTAMESGPMLPMASNRTTGERRVLAEFVSGKRLSRPLNTIWAGSRHNYRVEYDGERLNFRPQASFAKAGLSGNLLP